MTGHSPQYLLGMLVSRLNVHSIRRGLSTGIKAERKARTSADTQKAGAVHQGQATDTSTTPDRMMLSLHKGKHKQHKVSIQKDIAEVCVCVCLCEGERESDISWRCGISWGYWHSGLPGLISIED